MADAIKFAEDGAMDAGKGQESTNPPSAGTEGTSGGIEFVGDGGQDVQGNSSNTTQHDPSVNSPKGAGSTKIDFAGDV